MSNNNSSQQMLYRETPQVQEPAPQQQSDIEFSKGGGSGGGKAFYSYSSSSSSVQCRTNPENPEQQICKKITRQSYLDPKTGKPSQRVSESEEYIKNPGGLFGGFMGGGPRRIGFDSQGGSNNNGAFPQNRNFENNNEYNDQNKPSIINRLKNYLNLNNDIDGNYQQYQQQQSQQQQQQPQPYQNQGMAPPPQDPYDRLITRQMNPFRMLEESERQIRSMFGEDMSNYNEPGYGNPFNRGGQDGDIFDEFEREFFRSIGGMGLGGLFGPPPGFGRHEGFHSGHPYGNSYSQSWSSSNSFGNDNIPHEFQGNRGNFRQPQNQMRPPYQQQQNTYQQQRQQNLEQQYQQEQEQQFQIKQTPSNPSLQGIKFTGKIYDV